ncbi:FkbM family methyltransferase [Pannonibacter tanglangensis]|uniref:FkbM family methyltransferase n=1 Tax=Pannonibacter tanglangensis TaxID=2750084 RepID=A0ABW9ZNE3_9HYPH|nr:FkbM family methyltransferase [Pannonibacter sp. XCT-34]NBN65623.1 FkbM family methyltransferase [Pannonibacter sp. XCT-34]
MASALARPDITSPFGTYRAEGLVKFAWALADRHDLSATLRKMIRARVARVFAGPYDAVVEGLRFRLYPGANYDDRKMMAKGRLPEQAEHRLIAPLLRPGCVFVDVGANIGTYSLFAAACGAEVLAVEASPDTADKLAFNLAANDAAGVRLVRTAVGAEAGELSLWREPSNAGFATLVEDLTRGEWAGNWSAFRVPVRPLADVVTEAGLTRIDVLKIDVEGFEDRVLVPYLTTTSRSLWPRAILIETNCRPHWTEDCLSLLAHLGYEQAGETRDNILFSLKD